LVKKSEFSRFKQNFENYRDAVDRLTDVLLKGYKNDADHTLKSKVSKTEVEDLMYMKFDHERGKELERENRDHEKQIKRCNDRIADLEKTITTIEKGAKGGEDAETLKKKR
jgi:gas vesicle protein